MIGYRRSWTIVVAVVLGLATSSCTGARHPDPGEVRGADPSATASPLPPPTVASVDLVFAKPPVFGVSLPEVSEANVAKAQAAAGCKPRIVNRFVSVASGISTATLKATPGIPMVSLEPWYSGRGAHQSEFTLKATIDGKWDAQYKQLAQAMLGYREPLLVRFAHEFNGNWYPWGVANGNTTAQFVAAWKHVVDIFRAMGATNVLWTWSPNILRGATSIQISQFWPGDAYVDVVGMTGYGTRESSPEQTFGPTLAAIEAITHKPLLLTETGAVQDASKSKWIAAFGGWLATHPRVLGFIWFQSDRGENWRFDDTPANRTSFVNSLKTAKVSC